MPVVESCRSFSQLQRMPAVFLSRSSAGFFQSKWLTSKCSFPLIVQEIGLHPFQIGPSSLSRSKDGRQVHSKGIIVKMVSKMSDGAGLRVFPLCFASPFAVRSQDARQQRIGGSLKARPLRAMPLVTVVVRDLRSLEL